MGGTNEWIVVGNVSPSVQALVAKKYDGEEKCVVRASFGARLSWLFEQSDRRIMSKAKDKYMWMRYYNSDGEEYGRVEAASRVETIEAFCMNYPANKGVTDPCLRNLFAEDQPPSRSRQRGCEQDNIISL